LNLVSFTTDQPHGLKCGPLCFEAVSQLVGNAAAQHVDFSNDVSWLACRRAGAHLMAAVSDARRIPAIVCRQTMLASRLNGSSKRCRRYGGSLRLRNHRTTWSSE